MLIGGVAAVVVIVVIALVAWPRSQPACTPSSVKPDVGSLTVKNVASSDFTTLANLAGYVTLTTTTKDKKTELSYLPVDLETVEVVKSGTTGSVRFTGQCVTLEVDCEEAKDNNGKAQYKYKAINMQVKNDASEKKTLEKVCKFDTPFAFMQPADQYYTCPKEQSHSCTGDKDTSYSLNLKSIEFELDDKPEEVKAGKFVKKAFTESCTQWDK